MTVGNNNNCVDIGHGQNSYYHTHSEHQVDQHVTSYMPWDDHDHDDDGGVELIVQSLNVHLRFGIVGGSSSTIVLPFESEHGLVFIID